MFFFFNTYVRYIPTQWSHCDMRLLPRRCSGAEVVWKYSGEPETRVLQHSPAFSLICEQNESSFSTFCQDDLIISNIVAYLESTIDKRLKYKLTIANSIQYVILVVFKVHFRVYYTNMRSTNYNYCSAVYTLQFLGTGITLPSYRPSKKFGSVFDATATIRKHARHFTCILTIRPYAFFRQIRSSHCVH